MPKIIQHDAFHQLMLCLEKLPQGVVKMSETMEGTPETSNNVGRVYHDGEALVVTTHTRSFINNVMESVAAEIADVMAESGAVSQTLMKAPAWKEDAGSPFIKLTSDVFNDVLGWRPRMVAMHFVLEAGYLVQKFPGLQIASIGPRIVEPHSTSERVQISTIEDIWKVFINLLARMA